MSRPAPESPPATRLLRGCVLVTALAAVSALVASSLVGAPTGVLLGLLVVGAAAAPDLFPSDQAIRARRVLSAVVIAVASLSAIAVHPSLDVDAAIANLPGQLAPRLALLAAGLLVAQLLLGDRQREVLVSLLVCAGLFVFALAAAPGPAVGAALAVAWPAALTALAVAQVGRARAAADVRATVDGRVTGPVGAGPVATLVVGSAVVALLVVLLGPHPQGLQHGGRGPAGPGDPGATTGSGRGLSFYTHGELDMTARGQLPDVPVADVPLDSPELWLATTLALYDGTSWRTSGPGSVVGPALPGGPPYALPPDPEDVVAATREDTVRARSAFDGVLLAPGHPVALDVEATVLPIGSGYFIASSSPAAAPPTSYVVTSRSSAPPAATARPALGRPAGPTGAGVYSALPDTVPARVLELGRRLTAGAATTYDATTAVERYLRRHATYDLDSPVPPRGVDAVDHFLFTARTGFCEQFAAAEVVLLRAAGFPARLATGFAGGTVDGDHRTLRGTDAHAWVEVLHPGVGWVSSDPTAGTRPATGASLRDRLAELLRDAEGRAVVAGILVAVSLLGAAAAWVARRSLRRVRSRRRSRRRLVVQPPVLAAFRRLEDALDRAGAPRSGSESLTELGTRPRLAPVAGALAVLERACYAASPPTAEDSDTAVRALDDLTRQVLADVP